MDEAPRQNIEEEQTYRKFVQTLLEDMRDDVKEIKTQTQKTNGRVTALESWRAYSNGATAVIILLLVPILIYQANQWLMK